MISSPCKNCPKKDLPKKDCAKDCPISSPCKNCPKKDLPKKDCAKDCPLLNAIQDLQMVVEEISTFAVFQAGWIILKTSAMAYHLLSAKLLCL